MSGRNLSLFRYLYLQARDNILEPYPMECECDRCPHWAPLPGVEPLSCRKCQCVLWRHRPVSELRAGTPPLPFNWIWMSAPPPPPSPGQSNPLWTPRAPGENITVATPRAPLSQRPQRAITRKAIPPDPRPKKRRQPGKRRANRQRGLQAAPPTLMTAVPPPVPQMTPRPTHCDQCPRIFRKRGEEAEHRKGHESTDATLPACSVCGFRCRPQGMGSHSAMHLRVKPT